MLPQTHRARCISNTQKQLRHFAPMDSFVLCCNLRSLTQRSLQKAPSALPMSNQSGSRISHLSAALVQDMRVNHRRTHVCVPEQLLDGPDVVAVRQQMRCKSVPEPVTRRAPRQTATSRRIRHCAFHPAAVGCHSSTLFPSGSMTQANLPYSESSILSSTLQPSALSAATRA